MIEPIFIVAFPILFIIAPATGGVALRRLPIHMDGAPPINRDLFLPSKLAMVIPWAAKIPSLGLNLFPANGPRRLKRKAFGKEYEDHCRRVRRCL